VRKHKRDYNNKRLPTTPTARRTLPITSVITEDKIHFRFDHFDAEHPHFKDSNFPCEWASALLRRLKDLQRCTIDYFKKDRGFRKTQHVHPIEWENANLYSFGIHNGEEFDDDAWQFGLSKTAGRVHGFFIDNLFYIVWLDPEHRLFKYKDPVDN
jgi:hypothetical protein